MLECSFNKATNQSIFLLVPNWLQLGLSHKVFDFLMRDFFVKDIALHFKETICLVCNNKKKMQYHNLLPDLMISGLTLEMPKFVGFDI